MYTQTQCGNISNVNVLSNKTKVNCNHSYLTFSSLSFFYNIHKQYNLSRKLQGQKREYH